MEEEWKVNRKLKVIFLVFLLIVGLFFVKNEVFADDTVKKGKQLAEVFDGKNNTSVSTDEGKTLIQKIIVPILSVVRIVAIGMGIIMITYLGIKYMSAAPTEKANIKNQLITFAIGIAVVVTATTVLQIINTAVTSITQSGS